MRALPDHILKSALSSKPTLEALRVQEKYADPKAVIGENELDYIALRYMNPEAALFWLPRLVSYATVNAPKDSYHFEALLFNLSEAKFSAPLISEATDDEKRIIETFLNWLETETDFLTGSSLRQNDLNTAKRMWGEKTS